MPLEYKCLVKPKIQEKNIRSIFCIYDSITIIFASVLINAKSITITNKRAFENE